MNVKVCDDDWAAGWCPFCERLSSRWGHKLRCRHMQPADLSQQLRGCSPPGDCPLRAQPETIGLAREIES